MVDDISGAVDTPAPDAMPSSNHQPLLTMRKQVLIFGLLSKHQRSSHRFRNAEINADKA